MFGDGKTKNEKQEDKLQKFMEKYNLDELSPKDMISVKKIAQDLVSSGVLKFTSLITAKGEDNVKIAYLSAQVDQNWLIINQLSRLNANIEKLANK